MLFRACLLAVLPDPQPTDAAGALLIEELATFDAALVHRERVPPDVARVTAAARAWLGRCDVLLLTGGCGPSPSDVTPAAVASLLNYPLPGFGELMRRTLTADAPELAASRCGAGIAADTLVIWLPGRPAQCQAALRAIAPAVRRTCAALRQPAS